jgi:hypothetical protein
MALIKALTLGVWPPGVQSSFLAKTHTRTSIATTQHMDQALTSVELKELATKGNFELEEAVSTLSRPKRKDGAPVGAKSE